MQYKGMELCDFCFSHVNKGEACSACGFTHENYKYLYSKILAPGTILLGKYIIGRVLKKDESRTAYLAYTSDCERVVVTEYLPSAIIGRNNGEEMINIPADKKDEFLSGAKEFVDNVERLRSSGKGVSDIFYTNGTVYYCTRYENVTKAGTVFEKTLDINSKAAQSNPAMPSALNAIQQSTPAQELPEKAAAIKSALTADNANGALLEDIIFAETFCDGFVDGGKRAGGSVMLVYRHNERAIVSETITYSEGGNSGSDEILLCNVPQDINTLEELYAFVSENHPNLKPGMDEYYKNNGLKAPVSAIGDSADIPRIQRPTPQMLSYDMPNTVHPDNADIPQNSAPDESIFVPTSEMSGYDKKHGVEYINTDSNIESTCEVHSENPDSTASPGSFESNISAEADASYDTAGIPTDAPTADNGYYNPQNAGYNGYNAYDGYNGYGEMYPVKKKRRLLPILVIIGGIICAVIASIIVLVIFYGGNDDGAGNGQASHTQQTFFGGNTTAEDSAERLRSIFGD